jgi:hypothetical protein
VQEYRRRSLRLSSEEGDEKKGMAKSTAAKEKDPTERVRELLNESKGDRKATATAMTKEGYNRVEIGHAFKVATGDGLSPNQWKEWDLVEKRAAEVRDLAAPVITAEEKAFAQNVAAKLKAMDEKIQTQIIDLGLYVFESVTPLVPADTAEEKVQNTKGWLADAVTAFDPEKMRVIERFGAQAFFAAQTLKAQIAQFMMWAEPSTRLQEMAEKALYSPNPINKDAFNLLMLELVKSVRAVPAFDRKTSLAEYPVVVKAYAEARGIPPEQAQELMDEALQEVL